MQKKLQFNCRRIFTFVVLLNLGLIISAQAQPVPDINCSPNVFFGTVGNTIHRVQFNANSVTDLGIYANSGYSTLYSVAYGYDIINNSTNRTLYSATQVFPNPCAILRYNGTSWDTVATDPLTFHNAAGHGRFIYFQHSGSGAINDQCIARLNANGTLTKIFTDTTLKFTVADMAVDSTGNIYCFRGPAIGFTSEITVLDTNGVILNSFSTNLNNLSTLYGAMFMNGTLYLGWGTTNGLILPVIFSGATASLGTGLTVPSGFSMKDLANCHELIVNTSVNEVNEIGPFIYFDPFDGNLIIGNNSQFDRIRIYDVSGRIILSKKCEAGSNFFRLDGVRPGIYMVALFQTNTNSIFTRKVLKQ